MRKSLYDYELEAYGRELRRKASEVTLDTSLLELNEIIIKIDQDILYSFFSDWYQTFYGVYGICTPLSKSINHEK